MKQFHHVEGDYLEDWIKRPDRKPLIIRGARQVGKSTLVRLFAQENNLRLIELDFELRPEYATLFDNRDPEKILALLSATFNEIISPENTVLFLDEVQVAPEVLKSIRYFYEQLPQLAIIITGSLLDFVLKEIHFSMPVGRVEYMYLTPLSFEGFLWALDEKQLLHFLQTYVIRDSIPGLIHQKLIDFLKLYFIIGGLPSSIASYLKTRQLIDVMRVHQGLLTSYQDDFSKYTKPAEQQRLKLFYRKIPILLGEKFKYSQIDPHQKAGVLRDALHYLQDARLITLVQHTDANGFPLAAEADDKHFKCYFLDIGLASSVLNLNLVSYHEAIDLTLVNNGKIAEQFVAQELLNIRERFESPQIFYWQRHNKSASAELDFVVAINGKIIPIEVKAGTTGSLKSLHYFLSEKNRKFAIKVCQNPPSACTTTVLVGGQSIEFSLISLPFYLLGQIRRFIV